MRGQDGHPLGGKSCAQHKIRDAFASNRLSRIVVAGISLCSAREKGAQLVYGKGPYRETCLRDLGSARWLEVEQRHHALQGGAAAVLVGPAVCGNAEAMVGEDEERFGGIQMAP